MSDRKQDPVWKRAVFTPPQTAQLGVRHVENAINTKDRAVPLHIDGVSDYFDSVLPGEIVAVQAQTHNYKSGFIDSWESYLARHLYENRPGEIIIHADFETVVEHQSAREMAKVISIPMSDLNRGNVPDTGSVKAASGAISGVPIYRIGASLGPNSVEFNDLYLSNVLRAIRYIKSDIDDPRKRLHDEPRQIAAIFLDYLQAFPFDPEVKRSGFEKARRLQVRSDVYRIRSAAAKLECPIIVALQARQDLKGAPSQDFYVPGRYDGKETSDIGERFDRIISLWMPKTTKHIGELVEYKDIAFTVTENLLWLKVNKQRGGLPSGRSFLCEIDFTENIIRHSPDLVQRRYR